MKKYIALAFAMTVGFGVWAVGPTAYRDVVIKNSLHVGSSTAANSAAVADFSGTTTKGILLPTLTSTQKVGIASPTAGLMVYDSTLANTFLYNGSNWQQASVPTPTVGNGGLPLVSGGILGNVSFNTISSAAISSPFYLADGTAGAPSLSFTNDNASGVYRVGANEWGLSVGGGEALDLHKSTSGFGNIGLGGAASTSDSFPLYVNRTAVGTTQMQVNNPDTGAGSGTKIQAVADNGNNQMELSAFTAATAAPDIYAGGRGVARAAGSLAGLSLIADSGASSDVRLYAGGDAITNRIATASSSGLTLGVAGSLTGALNLAGSTSGNVTIKPQNAAGTYTVTLPNSQCSNGQTWINDGSGNFSCGTAGGNGTKNYLGTINGTSNNGDAESGGVGSWVLGHASLTSNFPSGAPTFGSGSSVNLSLGTTTTQPLSGTYSFTYVSSAGDTVGDFLASPAFTVDYSDSAKVMQIKFSYQLHAGVGNGENFSGTSANTWGIAIYDVTNSAWIMPAGVWNLTQGQRIGGPISVGTALATFQTAANVGSSGTYRLVVFNANATTGGQTLYFDDFFVGPQTASMGPAMSDWQSFTPTGSWSTNTAYSGQWRRVGGDMEIQARVLLSGAPNSANLSINLPSGYTIDTSKLTNTTNGTLGWVNVLKSGNANYFGSVLYKSSSDFWVYVGGAAGSYVNGALVTQAIPVTFASADEIDVYVKVPITGWSSNTVQSSDTDTRVVTFSAAASATTVASTATTLNWTALTDTHSGFNGTTTYTIPVSGYYRILMTGILQTPASGGGSSGTQFWNILKNGSAITTGSSQYGTTFCGASNYCTPVTLVTDQKFNAGDTVIVQSNQNAGGTSSPSFNQGQLVITRDSGSAVVQATETVSAFTTDQTPTGTLANADNIVKFGALTKDDHGAYSTSTGLYTAPVAGTYHVDCEVEISATWSSGSWARVAIGKNGSTQILGQQKAFNSVTTTMSPQASGLISLNAGDTTGCYSNTNGATPTYSTSITGSSFSVYRVGN